MWQFNLADDSVIAGDGARRSVHEQLIVLLTSCRRLVVGLRQRLGVAMYTGRGYLRTQQTTCCWREAAAGRGYGHCA